MVTLSKLDVFEDAARDGQHLRLSCRVSLATLTPTPPTPPHPSIQDISTHRHHISGTSSYGAVVTQSVVSKAYDLNNIQLDIVTRLWDALT